ncbi:pyrroline-5-carboxylate reductase [Leifsonia sp. fls2-241-R2A-40a]|uniref:pyrroline-5-carboxylate reductase n=1 Tax=Leifsonia sp. fls2-241-R2A-40a TaxID=3040290 RepID=UPI00254FF5D8|nr:pyrroline-5-carboxylate reductase [Leifsonia sp. fls2-241-R2A-40a]
MDDTQNVTLPTIAMLGAGSMGRAILSGLLAPGVQVAGIRVTNRSEARAAELAGTPGVTAYATETTAEANRLAVDGAQVVIVAVKPAMVRDLLGEISASLAPGTVVVSVAAGVTTETMESLLPDTVSVVRAMPNTPAVVGKAVTGISAGSGTDPKDLAVVRTLFETVGEVVEVPESQLDALGTISGSGPAYVFFLIEALTEAAVQKGFSREQAATLVNGTFLGASELLVSSGEDPAELRRRVTSPNGTTERAIAVLADADLPALFTRATDAALARSRELSAG